MKISSLARINFSIVMLCMSSILFAKLSGLMPDERAYQAENRVKLCESLSTNVSSIVGDHNLLRIGKQFELFASQNADLISVGLRRHDGELVVSVGSHSEIWENSATLQRDGCYIIPIENSRTKWGQIEIQFSPLYAGLNQFFDGSLLKLLVFVALLVGLATWLHLRRVLRHLDPSNSVPPRVRDVLNSFAEGVSVLDTEDRIVLSNQSFAKHVGKSQEELWGTSVYALPWRVPEDAALVGTEDPSGAVRGTQMQLADENGQIKTIFSVNSSPVLDNEGKSKGVMMAFTDVTPLERNRTALLTTLKELNASKREITKQNEELRVEQRQNTACTGDVMLAIGEQVERLVEAADVGDSAIFVALAERLRNTAEKHQVLTICEAASRAMDIAQSEDAQLEDLVRQSFELLAVCRELRSNSSALAATLESTSA